LTQTLPAAFPPLALRALDGSVRGLSRAAGPMLVSLGHGECATTRLLWPYLERIHRQRSAPAEVVFVLQDTPEDARAVVQELGLSAPVLLDPEPWALGAALGATNVPLTLLVTADGRIGRTFSAFRRTDVEEMAALLGVTPPLFAPDDPAPAFRPG
jgi:hypothetical protein